MTLYYAGIGSRKTPEDVQAVMTKIAGCLEKRGFVLRSGGAIGADRAFECGTDAKEIYHKGAATEEARTVACRYHPAAHALRDDALDLIARNGFQVLGPDLKTPSAFVVCWTSDGAETKTTQETGGTGQAIRLAFAHGIPVFNLSNNDALQRLMTYVKGW